MIDKLLIANRGEIARRVARTCRELGIMTVAVCSDPDLGAPIAREVDEVVHLPGRTAAETYLRIDRVVDAARRTGCGAVHPGYGFLAESADFARACVDAGVIFLGPPATVIERMASKLESKAVMETVGVPVLRGIDVTTLAPSARRAAADQVGWPLLVKASAGGGGRGIRLVREPTDLEDAVAGASREAAAAFGDATVLVERFVEQARHIEVQVVADTFGTIVHLFERECSVQRRYQKVIEESPSPAVDEPLRDALGRFAVAAAGAVGYVGVGTVEFLVGPGGDVSFLEMNTRLQVEHPVTEAVTGLDLVRVQILIGEGSPLPPEVTEARQAGHAIEARLYAEDPERGYAPVTGRVTGFSFPPRRGLRVDSAVEVGTEVTAYYDAMLAKVVVWAPSRPEAVRVLRASLRDAHVHGVATNRSLLLSVLSDERFARWDVDTGFLDRFRADAADGARPHRELRAGAAVVAAALHRGDSAGVLDTVPSGWRNGVALASRATVEGQGEPVEVEYRLGAQGHIRVADLRAAIADASPQEVVLEADGVRYRFSARHVGDDIELDGPGGAGRLRLTTRYPRPAAAALAGSLAAPLPGTVIRLLVEPGDQVDAGSGLLVLEAMKMEHLVAAPEAGVVEELRVQVGSQVEAGATLAVIRRDDQAPA